MSTAKIKSLEDRAKWRKANAHSSITQGRPPKRRLKYTEYNGVRVTLKPRAWNAV